MKIIIRILMGFFALVALLVGITLGFAMSFSKNMENEDILDVTKSALPTQILDIKGRLISEFFSDEKRSLVTLDEIPEHLIHAIITREDQEFYQHKGFSIRGIIRASLAVLRGKFAGGASTLTQQVARNRYLDPKEITISRKLREIWWATQLERRYTKDEILEFYLNEMSFGHGTNGVEAASQYYFNHSVRDITLAESVLLINALANHTLYSPIKNPEIARDRQIEILDQMVELGYATREEADTSFEEYWRTGYDPTRFAERGVWSSREDKAPWFSWYVKEQLDDMFLGSEDIFTGGLKVYTTLDLDYQKIADEEMAQGIKLVDSRYRDNSSSRTNFADQTFLPIVNLLSLGFNIRDLRTAGSKEKANAKKYYQNELNYIVDLLSLNFDIENLQNLALRSFREQKEKSRKTKVEGAMVSIDAEKGYILAMVGGREFDSKNNMFNRAAYGQVQPGSAFKPLYYSAAIESRQYTPATMLIDQPVVFWNDDGTPYVPLNYKGQWSTNGRVLLKDALARSLNVPSLKILEGIGFNRAIENASNLLGIYDPADIERIFPRKYPLGLGIVQVSPLQMVKAYSTFPSLGKRVTPIAIRYIENRDGRVILEPEKELREEQKKAGKANLLLSPEASYIMVDIMTGAIKPGGTLNYAVNLAGGIKQPMAGKTGTTDNWTDAWAVGYSPYMTTAVWFGFDTLGSSLGLNQSGAVAAGPVWAQYMKRAHEKLEIRDFNRPKIGLRQVEICALSGLLPDPTGACEGHTYKQWFIASTEPVEYCRLHKKYEERDDEITRHLQQNFVYLDVDLDSSIYDGSEFRDEEDSSLFSGSFFDEDSGDNPLLSGAGNPLFDNDVSPLSGDDGYDLDSSFFDQGNSLLGTGLDDYVDPRDTPEPSAVPLPSPTPEPTIAPGEPTPVPTEEPVAPVATEEAGEVVPEGDSPILQ